MHGPGPAPLLAAGFDWLEAVLPLLFVIFWIVSQVVNLVRRVAGPAGPAPVVPRRPQPQADEVRVDLERQIEEFLRQSRAPREPAAPPPAAPRRQEARPKPPRPARPPQGKAAAAPRLPPPLPGQPRRLVERHLQPLGDAGDDVAEHVQDAFAHDLVHRVSPIASGDDGAGGSRAAGHASPMAAELAPALRDPATLRRLILMREVLDRPVERWD